MRQIDYEDLFSDIDQVIAMAGEAAQDTTGEELSFVPELPQLSRLVEMGLLEEDDVHMAEMSNRALLFLMPLLDNRDIVEHATRRRNLLRLLAAVSFQPEGRAELDELVNQMKPDEFRALDDVGRFQALFPKALSVRLLRRIVGYNTNELPDPDPNCHPMDPQLRFSPFEYQMLQADWSGYLNQRGYLKRSAQMTSRRVTPQASVTDVRGIVGALHLVASGRTAFTGENPVLPVPTDLAELASWIPNELANRIAEWREQLPSATTIRDLARAADQEERQLAHREESFTPRFTPESRALIFRLANMASRLNSRAGIIPWEEAPAILNVQYNDARNWLDDHAEPES